MWLSVYPELLRHRKFSHIFPKWQNPLRLRSSGLRFYILEKKGENVVDRKKMRNFTAEKDSQGFFLNTISYYLLFTYLFL